jgi:hypothetical protein
LDPWSFSEKFRHIDIAKIVFRGKLTLEFVKAVRAGDVPGIAG